MRLLLDGPGDAQTLPRGANIDSAVNAQRRGMSHDREERSHPSIT